MGIETEPLENTEDSAAYRWLIRGLYATAIGLNVWLLWKANSGDTETEILKARVRAQWRRVTQPIRTERAWERARNRMHFAAIRALEEPAELGKDPDG